MSETPESQRLCDFAWLRATNGGEAQGYPPIVRRLLAAHDEVEARLAEATALLEQVRDWPHNPMRRLDRLRTEQPAAPTPATNPLQSFDARVWARELLRLHSGKTIGQAPDGNCCYFNEGDAIRSGGKKR